jgi:glycosyltransferase involved in cell wall biosynthesis
MISYFFHKFNPANFRLVMTILVRDEADIIEANIRTHAALGVDAFAVMDNGSTDGTREILEKLSQEFEMIVLDETGNYKQAKWMLQLAKIARDKLGADWVINNDADEFYIPNNGLSLKENLSKKRGVHTITRYNMIPDADSIVSNQFFDAQYYVKSPVFYKKSKEIENPKQSIIIGKIGPKTIVDPHGLIYLRGGNHKALHWAGLRDYFRTGYDRIPRHPHIEVFHYSIRNYAQFEKNIINRKRLLESGKKVSMGPHYRRWVKMYNEGTLEQEFNQNIAFSMNDISVLEKFDIAAKNPLLLDMIVKS